MENKFKVGDKVIFEREPIEDEWQGIGHIFHDLIIGSQYTISRVLESSSYGPGISALDILESSKYFYPSSVFSLANPLKLELDKLKNIFLDSSYRIKLTRKDRRIFEALCKKFEIEINEGNRIASLEYPIVYAGHRLGRTGQNDICFFIKTEERDILLNFKDLIEPFKRFKDEVL